jgi:hypothetical protein
MSDRAFQNNDKKADEAPEALHPWVRPVLTRLVASDAELSTRNAGSDGPYSVS